MTKQHFKVIAEILRANHADYDMAASFAHYFQRLNPRFDRVRFMHACGIWPVYTPEAPESKNDECGARWQH